jgi:hypothetical protein
MTDFSRGNEKSWHGFQEEVACAARAYSSDERDIV